MTKRASPKLHSLADLQAELVRRHRQRVAECKAAVAAAARRLAEAEADLTQLTSQSQRIKQTHRRGKMTGGPVHGNAARPDTTLREAVLEIIRNSRKPIRTIEVKARAAALGYSVASVSTLIKFHAQRGAIRQVRHGWWEPAKSHA
jgi:hypothetical protein